jgi:hypothetical protein
MPEGHFGEEIAARYDDPTHEMFRPAAIEPVVDFLAALAGDGAAIELDIGTGTSDSSVVTRWPVSTGQPRKRGRGAGRADEPGDHDDRRRARGGRRGRREPDPENGRAKRIVYTPPGCARSTRAESGSPRSSAAGSVNSARSGGQP